MEMALSNPGPCWLADLLTDEKSTEMVNGEIHIRDNACLVGLEVAERSFTEILLKMNFIWEGPATIINAAYVFFTGEPKLGRRVVLMGGPLRLTTGIAVKIDIRVSFI